MNRHWNSYLNRALSRRELLRVSSTGFGGLALAGLLAQEQAHAAVDPLAVKAPHFPARAKRVIFLFMHGGPSQVDTFDYKPLLKRDHGNSYGQAQTPPCREQQPERTVVQVGEMVPSQQHTRPAFRWARS